MKKDFENTGWSEHSTVEKKHTQASSHFVVQGNFKEYFNQYLPKIPQSIVQKFSSVQTEKF